jgi:hypothetical protein
MTRYLVPAGLTLLLATVLVSLNRGFKSLDAYFSSDFAVGFLAGVAFLALVYGLVIWLDPASRPRGSSAAADEQRSRNALD